MPDYNNINLYFLTFQMKDLEERRNDAEHRAESAEDKVSILLIKKWMAGLLAVLWPFEQYFSYIELMNR